MKNIIKLIKRKKAQIHSFIVGAFLLSLMIIAIETAPILPAIYPIF